MGSLIQVSTMRISILFLKYGIKVIKNIGFIIINTNVRLKLKQNQLVRINRAV